MLPTLVLRNQFGEVSNNFVEGGSGQLACNFVVDSANGNGLGIRSLKGTGIKNVFMHTSSSPLGGNPNPAAGYILVELEDAYAGYLNGTAGFVAPVSGTPINVTSGVTAGLPYVITSVGTTPQSQWEVLGLPAGIPAEVGASFIAIASTTATGTGAVMAPKSTFSGIDHLEVVGDPNQSCNPTDGTGARFLLACVSRVNGAGVITMNSYTPAGTNDSSTPPIFTGTPAVLTGNVSAGTDTDAVAAPADGTVIGLTFNMTAVAQELI